MIFERYITAYGRSALLKFYVSNRSLSSIVSKFSTTKFSGVTRRTVGKNEVFFSFSLTNKTKPFPARQICRSLGFCVSQQIFHSVYGYRNFELRKLAHGYARDIVSYTANSSNLPKLPSRSLINIISLRVVALHNNHSSANVIAHAGFNIYVTRRYTVNAYDRRTGLCTGVRK